MPHIHVEGRYPADPRPLKAEYMHVQSDRSEDELMIRIEDQRNDDFWLTVTIDWRELFREILQDN